MNTSTQVQHPWRTTLRTVVWVVLAVVAVVPGAWAIVQDEVTKAGLVIPAGVATRIAFGVAVCVAVTAIVQRLVLLPRIAELIAKIPGLAPAPVTAEPKRAIEPATPLYSAHIEGQVVTGYTDGTKTTEPGV